VVKGTNGFTPAGDHRSYLQDLNGKGLLILTLTLTLAITKYC